MLKSFLIKKYAIPILLNIDNFARDFIRLPHFFHKMAKIKVVTGTFFRYNRDIRQQLETAEGMKKL